jgi:hypothetical protein
MLSTSLSCAQLRTWSALFHVSLARYCILVYNTRIVKQGGSLPGRSSMVTGIETRNVEMASTARANTASCCLSC